jgi:hypothetical protein
MFELTKELIGIKGSENTAMEQTKLNNFKAAYHNLQSQLQAQTTQATHDILSYMDPLRVA